MDSEEKIKMILTWADDHPKFDRFFVEEMEEKLDQFGGLTENQTEALDHIIDKWGIHWA